MVERTLYTLPGSHACVTGLLLLSHKRLPFREVRFPPLFHPIGVRLAGFPGGNTHRSAGSVRSGGLAFGDRLGTVPALRDDGRKVQTNLAISRYLDERYPDPPLFPADTERRAAVEEAERWGDDVLQTESRRLLLAAGRHGLHNLANRGDAGRNGFLLFRSPRLRLATCRYLSRKVFNVGSHSEPELLERAPELLDHVDALIADGTLNGAELNAADLMIAPCLALMDYRLDLRPLMAGRPLMELLDRVLPDPTASAAAA